MTAITATPVDMLRERYKADITPEQTSDAVPTCWCPRGGIREILNYLKNGIDARYKMLMTSRPSTSGRA